MSGYVSLARFIDHIQSSNDQTVSYMDRETGSFQQFNKQEVELFDLGAGIGNLPGWQQAIYDQYHQVEESERYIRLPSNWEMHEVEVMADFFDKIAHTALDAELLNHTRVSGSLTRFHAALKRHQLEEAWQHFRNLTFKQIACDWLKTYKIPYVDDTDSNAGNLTNPEKKIWPFSE
jgi:hypothetical protein